MIIEFASGVSNLAWRVSQSQNGGAIFARTKWSPMFGSVVFDYQWCILIVMNVKNSFYNEYDIKNNEKPVFWAQRSFQNHHQTFHDRCPEKIGSLPKKSDHWSTRTCPENIRPAPTCSWFTLYPKLGSEVIRVHGHFGPNLVATTWSGGFEHARFITSDVLGRPRLRKSLHVATSSDTDVRDKNLELGLGSV